MSDRPIPTTLSITAYMHCGKCIDELPRGVSPSEYQRLEIGLTDIGLQVWCKRHNLNVAHIDFDGAKVRINTSIDPEAKDKLGGK